MPYIDLAWELKENPTFRGKIVRYVDEVQRISRSNRPEEKARAKLILADIWRECNFNVALLMPYFFPLFDQGKPFRVGRRPANYALYSLCPGGATTIRGGRQFGKSTSLGSRQLSLTQLINGWRTMYICPHSEHKETYGNKLRELEASSSLNFSQPGYRNNLYYKEWTNRSVLYVIRVMTSAAATRGKTVDEFVYDEYQLFNPDFEEEIRPMQTTSDMPVTIYAGTSTWLDSPLEARFQASSQGTWHIRTHREGKYIDCGDVDQVLSMIGPDGPVCPHTGWELDVANGFFAHHYASRLEENLIGLHVPQVAIPEFTSEFKYWSKIVMASRGPNRNQFAQEILGIPCEAGHREVTEERLRQICVLTDNEETRKRKARDGTYRYIISGCDWGGSEFDPVYKIKTSYTAHAIIGLAEDGYWDILHLRRYPGQSYMQIADSIIKDHVAFGGYAVGSDAGGGMAYNSYLRASGRVPIERHMVFHYGGLPTTPILAPMQVDGATNYYILNRGESLSALFGDINRDPPGIRCFSWDQSRIYLMDFLNVMRVIAETRGGQQWFQHHRNPTKADDIMHAINYARVVGRMILGEPMFHDPSVGRRIRDMLRGQAVDSVVGRAQTAGSSILGVH